MSVLVSVALMAVMELVSVIMVIASHPITSVLILARGSPMVPTAPLHLLVMLAKIGVTFSSALPFLTRDVSHLLSEPLFIKYKMELHVEQTCSALFNSVSRLSRLSRCQVIFNGTIEHHGISVIIVVTARQQMFHAISLLNRKTPPPLLTISAFNLNQLEFDSA